MCWWKKFFHWRENSFKYYIWNYVMLLLFFIVSTMQRNKWCRYKIFIYAGNHWILCILWYFYLLSFIITRIITIRIFLLVSYNFWIRNCDTIVLLSTLSSMHLLFWVISCFPFFPSDTCFLRQYPWFIRQNPVLPCFTCGTARGAQVGGG